MFQYFIPFYCLIFHSMGIPLLFIHSSVEGHLASLLCLAIRNIAAMKFVCKFYVDMFSFLSVTYLRVEVLGHTITLYVTSWGSVKLFSTVTALFYIPTIIEWGFLHILTNSCYCLFILDIVMDVQWYLLWFYCLL